MVKSYLENISVILKRETRATIKATAKTIATSKRLATVPMGSESESLCSNLFLLLFIVFVSLVRYSFSAVWRLITLYRYSKSFISRAYQRCFTCRVMMPTAAMTKPTTVVAKATCIL